MEEETKKKEMEENEEEKGEKEEKKVTVRDKGELKFHLKKNPNQKLIYIFFKFSLIH